MVPQILLKEPRFSVPDVVAATRCDLNTLRGWLDNDYLEVAKVGRCRRFSALDIIHVAIMHHLWSTARVRAGIARSIARRALATYEPVAARDMSDVFAGASAAAIVDSDPGRTLVEIVVDPKSGHRLMQKDDDPASVVGVVIPTRLLARGVFARMMAMCALQAEPA